MPIKVKTAAGFKDVIDIKVSNGDGTFRNVGKRVVKKDGVFQTVWQRPTANNLTQWHPRWAKIDTDAGYTAFTFTNELGNTVTPNPGLTSYAAVSCTGDRQNGAIYYYVSPKMYKKPIVNGVVGSAVVCWDDSTATNNFRINEETGAVRMRCSDSTFKVAPSVETLDTATIIQTEVSHTNGTVRWYTADNHWINDLILVGSWFYDSSGNAVRQLPSSIIALNTLAAPNLHIRGNDTDGYFIVRRGNTSGATVTFFEYDWVSNTAIQRLNMTSGFQVVPSVPVSNCSVEIDSQRAALIFGDNSSSNRMAYRTTDGVTGVQIPGQLGSGGTFIQNHYPHINISAYYRGFWNGNSDTVCDSAANSLFQGTVGNANGVVFYAGKKMCIEGIASNSRLWDIVPK
jgi:hypothetical protein